MTLTLLLDLDNTLLENDIEAFLPHYLKEFSQEVATVIPPDLFVNSLLAGTGKMVNNRRPDRTLRQAFESYFSPAVCLPPEEFQPLADHFYAEVFPKLKKYTQRKPETVAVIEGLLARGYRIAIATNPLFPRTAILQRLEWAGVPVEKYPYALVPSYETFHFVKPEPAFFAELLARLGWPDGPVAMVGDDLERDIAAARSLGLPAFWITRPGMEPPNGAQGPTKSGALADLLPWLDHVDHQTLIPNFKLPSAMLANLRATPAVFDTLIGEIDPAELQRRPQLGEWSLCEILCHLRDVDAEVNLPRLQNVLAQSNPFIPGQDTDPWAEQRGYNFQDGKLALTQFVDSRLNLLALIENLSDEEWQRPARHAIFGPTNLAELVGFISAHDRLHVQQAQQVIRVLSS